MYWAAHYSELIDDDEKDRLIPEFFGVKRQEMIEFFVDNLSEQSDDARCPYIIKELPASSYVEVEYNLLAEYEVRYSLCTGLRSGPILMGYDSGHFSLPAFRWDEIVPIANAHATVADQRSAAECLLLLYPSVWLSEDNDLLHVKDQLRRAWRSLEIVNEGALEELVEMLVKYQLSGNAHWTRAEGYGWVNDSNYSQRNPESSLSVMPDHGWADLETFFGSTSPSA